MPRWILRIPLLLPAVLLGACSFFEPSEPADSAALERAQQEYQARQAATRPAPPVPPAVAETRGSPLPPPPVESLTPAQIAVEDQPERLLSLLRNPAPRLLLARFEALRRVAALAPPGAAEALVAAIPLEPDTDLREREVTILLRDHPAAGAPAARSWLEEFRSAQEVRYRELRLQLARAAVVQKRAELYGPALAVLGEPAQAADLFRLREAIRAAGPAIVPALQKAADAHPQDDSGRIARRLARWIENTPDIAAAYDDAFTPRGIAPAGLTLFRERFGKEAVPYLRQALLRAYPNPPAVMIDALRELDDQDSGPKLLDLAKAPGPALSVRVAALKAIGQLETPGALPILLAAARDDTPGLSTGGAAGREYPLAQAALYGLGFTAGAEAYQALLAALGQTEKPQIVAAAAEALGRRGDARALPALRTVLVALRKPGQPENPAVLAAIRRLTGAATQPAGLGAGARKVYLLTYQAGSRGFTLATDVALWPEDPAGHTRRLSVTAWAGPGGEQTLVQHALLLPEEDYRTLRQAAGKEEAQNVEVSGQAVQRIDLR